MLAKKNKVNKAKHKHKSQYMNLRCNRQLNIENQYFYQLKTQRHSESQATKTMQFENKCYE